MFFGVTATRTFQYGYQLSYQCQADNWYAYINNGQYDDEQQGKLVAALIAAQEREFDSMLPAGSFWHPHTSEISFPDGAGDLADFGCVQDAMEAAFDRTAARYDDIEREALGQ